MIAAYVRTSTRSQDGDAQRYALTRMIQARGVAATDVQWFEDIGHSGAKDSRPALNAMLKGVHAGEFLQVYVYALDRLGRSLRHLITLMSDFEASGCKLVSLRESIDLSTPTGRLQAQMLSALAEFERALIRERVVSGIVAVQQEAEALGNPLTHKLGAPTRCTPDQLAEARAMRARGQSWRTVARSVGVPRRTIQRALEAGENYRIVEAGTWRAESRKVKGNELRPS